MSSHPFSMPPLWKFGDHSFQATEELLPAVLRSLIVCFLIGTEAGMLHAHQRSVFGRNQCENDYGPLPESSPAIGKLFLRFDHQNFAVDDAVPIRHRLGAQSKLMAHGWLEVVFHQPLFN